MASKFKDLGVRVMSAVIMAFIAGLPVILGGPWFVGLAVFVIVRVIYEWVRMADPRAPIVAYILPMAGCGAAVLYAAFDKWEVALGLIGLTAILAGAERAMRERAVDQLLADGAIADTEKPLKAAPLGVAWSGLGVLYLALPALAMLFVRGADVGPDNAGFKAFIFVLLSVIGADVGAYLGGSAIGGAKIAPKLSPKKTWSGFLSGLIFGSIVGVASAIFMGVSPYIAIILAVPVIIFSVIGDFVESGFKRKLNVKDTGEILPGHGGLLDRIDSLMFAMSFFALLILIFPNIWAA